MNTYTQLPSDLDLFKILNHRLEIPLEKSNLCALLKNTFESQYFVNNLKANRDRVAFLSVHNVDKLLVAVKSKKFIAVNLDTCTGITKKNNTPRDIPGCSGLMFNQLIEVLIIYNSGMELSVDDITIHQSTKTVNIADDGSILIKNNHHDYVDNSELKISNDIPAALENNNDIDYLRKDKIPGIEKSSDIYNFYDNNDKNQSDFFKNIASGKTCEINISQTISTIKQGGAVGKQQIQQEIKKEVLLNTATQPVDDAKKCNYNELLRVLQYHSITLFKSQKAIEILVDFVTTSKNRCIFNINDPGTGKTISIITFIFRLNELIMMRRIEPMRVCLLSFARTVFVNDLIRSPDFNYIPISAHLAELTQDEKRAVGKNMYFDAYGYRQFASRVLEITNEGLFNQYIIDNSRTDPMVVLKHLGDLGIVKINQEFVKKFNNTVVVVDEGQRLQNSSWINHYGYALICIRDLTNAFFIYISATILNSKNTELAFVQRLLNNYYPYEKCFTADGKLIPTWRTDIISRFDGVVFYSGAPDLRYTPQQVYVGGKLKFNALDGKVYVIDNHRKYYFVKMSKTMAEYHKIVLPQMQYAAHLFLIKIADKFIYTKEDMRWLMSNKQSLHEIGLDVNIEVVQNVNGVDDAIRLSGPMLKKKNLAKIVPKMHAVLTEFIDNRVLLDEGKTMVVTDDVRFPGLLLIEDILRENGFIPNGLLPQQQSICLACLKTKSQHDLMYQKMTKNKNIIDLVQPMTPNERLAYFRSRPGECYHFFPIYFETVHAYMTNIDKSIQRFNDPSNIHGINYKIMIGSYVLAVAYSFLQVKRMFIVSVPYSITFLQQLEKRPVRAHSLDGLVEKTVYMYIMCMTYDDPTKLTREELAYIEHHYDYSGIKEIIDELRNIAVDKDMYLSTQSDNYLESIRDIKINDSYYYANNFAIKYMDEIIMLIKQLFTRSKVLSIDTIVERIRENSCHINTETNTSFFTRRDILSALFVLLNSPREASPKYYKSSVGIAILYKSVNCNIVVHDGIVCSIEYFRDGIYRLIPKTINGYSVLRPGIEFNSMSHLSTVFRFRDQDFDKTKSMTIESIEQRLIQYSIDLKFDFLAMFSKEQLINIIKIAIINWSAISEKYKSFIWLFIKSREVFLRRHLRSINTIIPMDAPCGYLYGGIVHYYDPKCSRVLSPTEQAELDEATTINDPRFLRASISKGTDKLENNKHVKVMGCWQKAPITPFVETVNDVKYIGYYNNAITFTLHSPREVANVVDNRFNVTGTKCQTLPKDIIANKVLSGLYKISLQKGMSNLKQIRSSDICIKIAELMAQSELEQWDNHKQLLMDKKKQETPIEFKRFIYFLEMIKQQPVMDS